jgi:hypothetical protein
VAREKQKRVAGLLESPKSVFAFISADTPQREPALFFCVSAISDGKTTISAECCILKNRWCGRVDSNHHGIATASPSSWCVCQFRHDRTEEINFHCSRAGKNGQGACGAFPNWLRKMP